MEAQRTQEKSSRAPWSPFVSGVLPPRWWAIFPLLAAVVAFDYLTVARIIPLHGLWRLTTVLCLAGALYPLVGRPPLPLDVRNFRASTKNLALIIGVGALVTIALMGGGILLARAGIFRPKLEPRNVPFKAHYTHFLIVAVLWAPLIEEVVYRALLHGRLRHLMGFWPAALLSSLAFWIYHWVAFGRITSPHHFGAGLLFAYSYEKSRSLLPPILLHALGNFLLGTGDLFYLTHQNWIHSLLGYS